MASRLTDRYVESHNRVQQSATLLYSGHGQGIAYWSSEIERFMLNRCNDLYTDCAASSCSQPTCSTLDAQIGNTQERQEPVQNSSC